MTTKRRLKELSYWIDSVYTGENVKDAYDVWSETYDRDFHRYYKGPEKVAELVLPEYGETVLDIGCGTGEVGKALSRKGGFIVDGIDISTGMLSKAHEKSVYKNLTLSSFSDFGIDRKYDICTAAGCFTTGHIKAELLRKVPFHLSVGGYFIVTFIDAYWESEGNAIIEDMLRKKVWETILHERYLVVSQIEGRPGEIDGAVYIFRKILNA